MVIIKVSTDVTGEDAYMLNVFYGDMPNVIYNTAVYFKNTYAEEWITAPLTREMIQDVDHSTVLDSGVIDSPVLGKIPPVQLSGGVKTLILIANEPEKVFNASTCGDNCAKWLLKIAENRDVTINLRHLMDFGNGTFTIRILNTNQIVHSMRELVPIAGLYVLGIFMTGAYRVVVQNRKIKFDFEIRRNITILRGDSATGKTTLVEMIREYEELGPDSGIELQCEKDCVVLSGRQWEKQLSDLSQSIVFIDEGNAFTASKEFAAAIQKTDNYYVLVTREGLETLPYSVTEIYGIRASKHFGDLKQTYNEFFRIYGKPMGLEKLKPVAIITEDSNSGFQFFQAVCAENGIICESAGGKSNIFKMLSDRAGENVLVVADGAAFGSQMERIMQLLALQPDSHIYLPESFEWLILRSGLLEDTEVDEILKSPENHVESQQYFSWERYFTAVLMQKTSDSYLKYTKSKLNPVYLQEHEKKAILSEMSRIQLDKKDI